MIKKLATSAALLLMVACASAPMTSSDSGNGGAAGTAALSTANATDYVLLSSATSLRQWDAINPVYSLHVRGTMTNRGFMPLGNVEGRGKLCQGNDWLSLSDLKIHKAGEGTPTAPYVLGCANGTSFTPASREVVTQ